jgi:hypothetical protein
VYVRADGAQFLQPAARFAAEALTIDIGAAYELARASNALELVTHRRAGDAAVLTR